jgi:hypothetical protein
MTGQYQPTPNTLAAKQKVRRSFMNDRFAAQGVDCLAPGVSNHTFDTEHNSSPAIDSQYSAVDSRGPEAESHELLLARPVWCSA